MALVNRGRLSVQPVEETTYGIMQLLADRGGWEDMNTKPTAKRSSDKPAAKKQATRKSKGKKSGADIDEETSDTNEAEPSIVKSKGRKRKATETEEDTDNTRATRRSTRLKT